jgi:hypothetical protein
MLNWVSTGDPYTWTEEDYAHESEVANPLYMPPDDDNDDFGLPDLFNETGYRGSSDINPDEPPAQLEEEEDELPNLEDLDWLMVDETPPGSPLQQSTPERARTPERTDAIPGAIPKIRPTMEAANKYPVTGELYPPFGPHDLYKARQQQIHQKHHDDYIKAKNDKTRQMLRRQLFQTLEDTETSFKLLLANPEMMKMTPEQLQQHLAQPEPKKKGIIRKLLSPRENEQKPRTRLQIRKEKDGESNKNLMK